MDEGLRLQAQEWFDRGSHDIETAQLLYDQGGYTDMIAYHIQQAIEKYLKGFLVFKGERPPRIHDLDKLLDLADKCEPGLYSPFIGFVKRPPDIIWKTATLQAHQPNMIAMRSKRKWTWPGDSSARFARRQVYDLLIQFLVC